jgi:hypothetical protein
MVRLRRSSRVIRFGDSHVLAAATLTKTSQMYKSQYPAIVLNSSHNYMHICVTEQTNSLSW